MLNGTPYCERREPPWKFWCLTAPHTVNEGPPWGVLAADTRPQHMMSSSTTAACSTTVCDAPQHSATLSVATVGDAPQRSAACARSRAAGDLGPRPFAIPRRRVALREGCLSPRPTMRVVVGDGHIRAYRPSRAPAHNLCSFAEPVMRAYRTHRVLPGGRAVARAVAAWHTCLSQVVLLLCGREAACMRCSAKAGP